MPKSQRPPDKTRQFSLCELGLETVGSTQFTPPHQRRQDGSVRVVSGVPMWIGRLLWTCSDFKFSVGDSLELSGIHFTPPKRTRHRQDSLVVSSVVMWISFWIYGLTSARISRIGRRICSVVEWWNCGANRCSLRLPLHKAADGDS